MVHEHSPNQSFISADFRIPGVGAAAGLLGGLAMLVAGPLLRRGLRRWGARPTTEWDRFVQAGVARAGLELSERAQHRAAVAVHLAYSAVWGVLWHALVCRCNDTHDRRRSIPLGVSALTLAMIMYAANFSCLGLMPRSSIQPPAGRQPVGEALVPAGTHLLFGLVTVTAMRYRRFHA